MSLLNQQETLLHQEFLQQKKRIENGLQSDEEALKRISNQESLPWIQLIRAQASLELAHFSEAKTKAMELVACTDPNSLIRAESSVLLGSIARIHRLFPDSLRFLDESERIFLQRNRTV